MQSQEQALDQIFEKLKGKACVKQNTFRTIQEVFKDIETEAKDIIKQLNTRINKVDKSVEVKFIEKNKYEFHLKVGSDMLIFSLATNVVTFNNEYVVMQSDYIKEKDERKYFGQIMVYNFLSDTIKYNRLDDPGYLIARLIVNDEKHFFVEGAQQLNFLFTDIVNNVISQAWLRLLIEKCILTAVDMDLIGSSYHEIQNTNLLKKMKNEKPMGNGQKVGFQMDYMNDIKA
ncbi:hypothetical protein QQ020_26920 [Fulvivirgaceae bacterium BMA12]|uniref:Uncharacterized protein n=1 Tax=Agaribacillus aureus TaxID=3051825 RepID=A0ABT8LD83_9BACT|nr:hypothetical protein [Fulvivirgaceae bacterium BMA12]